MPFQVHMSFSCPFLRSLETLREDKKSFENLESLMEYNVLNNIELVKDVISDVVKLRRRFRTRHTISRFVFFFYFQREFYIKVIDERRCQINSYLWRFISGKISRAAACESGKRMNFSIRFSPKMTWSIFNCVDVFLAGF